MMAAWGGTLKEEGSQEEEQAVVALMARTDVKLVPTQG